MLTPCGCWQATPWLDRFLFKPFKQAFGGRVRFVVSGGAPLATHVEEFLAAALCAPVFQVRGQSIPHALLKLLMLHHAPACPGAAE